MCVNFRPTHTHTHTHTAAEVVAAEANKIFQFMNNCYSQPPLWSSQFAQVEHNPILCTTWWFGFVFVSPIIYTIRSYECDGDRVVVVALCSFHSRVGLVWLVGWGFHTIETVVRGSLSATMPPQLTVFIHHTTQYTDTAQHTESCVNTMMFAQRSARSSLWINAKWISNKSSPSDEKLRAIHLFFAKPYGTSAEVANESS